jgi:hypothetical protein
MIVVASDVGVAAVTAVAAGAFGIVVALITARTTNTRQKHQLAAERKRQRRDLKERAKAQRHELNHARELADLDDLREVLDAATLVLANAKTVKHDAGAKVRWSAGARVERAEEAQAELDGVRARAAPVLARLQVRLGTGDEITEAFHAADVALLSMGLQAALLRSVSGLGDEIKTIRATFEKHSKALDTATKRFATAAVKRVGTYGLVGK